MAISLEMMSFIVLRNNRKHAPMQTKTHLNLTETDLPQLAAEYAPLWLRPGTVVALHGDLGMGKTAFVRAFVRHVMGEHTAVPSPTFTIVQPYETPGVTVYHYDLYRLSNENELPELSWEDAVQNGLVFVEWPERAGRAMPHHHWRIEVTDGNSPNTRNVTITPPARIHTAMVLAAGFGTRLRPLTDNLPKPLLILGGKTMLDQALTHLADVGVSHAVINVHYLGDKIIQHLKHHTYPLQISVSEEADILETGGGIKKALSLLNAPEFLTVNSDILWRDLPGHALAIERLMMAWDPDKMDTLLLLTARERAIGFNGKGDYFLHDNGMINSRGDAASAPYVFAGVSITKPHAFTHFPDVKFSQKKIWDAEEKTGRLHGLVHTGEWYHCSTPEDFEDVGRALRSAV